MKKIIEKNLEDLKIKKLHSFQEKYISFFDSKECFFLQAPTGSGKTLIYLMGAMKHLSTQIRLEVIIFAPTSDLVMQISRIAQILYKNTGIQTVPIHQDQSISRQIENLKKKKPKIIIGTPDRILRLIQEKKIKTKNIHTVICDEMDSLFEQKSYTQMHETLESFWDICIVGFWATTSERIQDFFTEIQGDIKIFSKNIPSKIHHQYTIASKMKHGEIIADYVKKNADKKILIFTKKTGHVGDLVYDLEKREMYPASINRFISSSERKLILQRFETGDYPVLITTDALMRGIDISHIDIIIHKWLAFKKEDYVHRSGRTGRKNTSGTSFSLLEKKEEKTFMSWAKEMKITLEKKEL